MVKTTDARESHYFGVRRRSSFNGATIRRISKDSVNTFGVVVADIVAKKSTQVIFIDRDDVIDDFPLARAHPAFGRSVLPGGVAADQAATSGRPCALALCQSS